MPNYKEKIIVTDWEKAGVNALAERNTKNVNAANLNRAKELLASGNLFVGYIVPAIYYYTRHRKRIEAVRIYIDGEGVGIISCKSVYIGNNHKSVFECKLMG